MISLIWTCWNGYLLAQFTYFSQLTGVQEVNETEQVSNIEVVDDGYAVWGGEPMMQLAFFILYANMTFKVKYRSKLRWFITPKIIFISGW